VDKVNWDSVELLGYSYYSSKGYQILVPLVHSCPYDFVAVKDGVYLKVNVKLAGLKDSSHKNSWSISMASGASKLGTSKHGEVDVFLVYMPSSSKFIELDGDFFNGSKSKSKLIPKHLI